MVGRWSVLAGFAALGAIVLFFGVAEDVEASHVRGGSLGWEPTGNPNEAQYVGDFAARSSFFGAAPIGSIIHWGTLFFGDGGSTQAYVLVTGGDPSLDWFGGVLADALGMPITHTYAAPGSYVAKATTSCWFSSYMTGVITQHHINNPCAAFSMETDVHITGTGMDNGSPKPDFVAIHFCNVASTCTFAVTGTDPESDPIKWRLALPAEWAGMTQPPGALSVTTGGTVTWITPGALPFFPGTVNRNYYSMGLIAEDPASRASYQFLIYLCDPVSSPPTDCPVGPPPPPPPPPVGAWRTYFDGSVAATVTDVEVDASGYVYVSGHTQSSDFPTTPGSFMPTWPGGNVAGFVAKFSPDDLTLVYSTFLGGISYDAANGLELLPGGEVVVVGGTENPGWIPSPVMPYSGKPDAFVVVLDPTGSSIIAGTYFGGPDPDSATDVAVGMGGEIAITGSTQSAALPILGGYPVYGGFGDAFAATFDPGLNLMGSTFYGGTSVDAGLSVAFDGPDVVFVGQTSSAGNPTVAAHTPAYMGGTDGFVVATDISMGAWIYATYLGGAGYDDARGVTALPGGGTAVTGMTGSAGFPTVMPIQPALNGPHDVFLTVHDPAGTIMFSTFYGGSGGDLGNAIAVDGSGNLYLTGITSSPDWPLVASGLFHQAAVGGFSDSFLLVIDAGWTSVTRSTYLGGTGRDIGLGVAVDDTLGPYVAGWTVSSDFPTTVPAYQTLAPSSSPGFVGWLL